MRRGRPLAELVVTPEVRATLERWTARRKTSQTLALRSRIVPRCSSGRANSQVAPELGITNATVGKWRSRYVAKGPGSSTSLESGRPGGSVMSRSSRWWSRRSSRRPVMPLSGARARWLRPPVSAGPRSTGSGVPSGSSPIAVTPSSSPPKLSLDLAAGGRADLGAATRWIALREHPISVGPSASRSVAAPGSPSRSSASPPPTSRSNSTVRRAKLLASEPRTREQEIYLAPVARGGAHLHDRRIGELLHTRADQRVHLVPHLMV